MRTILVSLVCQMFLGFSSFASTADSVANQTNNGALQLKRGEEISLELAEDLDARTAETGAMVKLIVYLDVKVDGKTVIATGTPAEGRLTLVRRPGAFGAPGILELRPENVVTVDGQRVPLRDLERLERVSVGKSRRGLALPLFVAGAFVKGGNAVLRKGEIIKAEVARDVFVKG